MPVKGTMQKGGVAYLVTNPRSDCKNLPEQSVELGLPASDQRQHVKAFEYSERGVDALQFVYPSQSVPLPSRIKIRSHQ